jgi:hypothetical protein
MLREFLAHLPKPDDETVTLYGDGRAVEISVSELQRKLSPAHGIQYAQRKPSGNEGITWQIQPDAKRLYVGRLTGLR